MPQRSVEHFPLPEILAPGNRVMTWGLAVRMFVQYQQFVNACWIVLLNDVDLVVDRERISQVFRGWMLLVLDNRVDGYLGSMTIEFSAKHFNVRRISIPMVQRVASAVHGHKGMSIPHPVNKRLSIR